MYIANVAEDGFENNPLLDRVREIAAAEDAVVVPVCAAIESELSELEDEDKLEFMADLGLEEPVPHANADGGVHGHQPLDHRPAHSAIGECLPHVTGRSLTLPSVIDHRQD